MSKTETVADLTAPSEANTEKLTGAITAAVFWRLVPEWWPLEFTVVTVELTQQVEHGLRRSLDEE
ncbi:hypothetical protein [Streptomyces sp. NPDC088400]|uniref:hypothetical protein n=1 Tax=Streptomyces sp. NPDC088400 TaxID=3365861 RepID=UPI00381B39D7